MKHAREDYNRIQDPHGLIPEDEPVFLLRAQDQLACKAVAYYASLCTMVQAPEVAAKARAHSSLMASWPKKKVPDLPAELPSPPLGCIAPAETALTEQDAALINQAHELLLDLEERERTAGNCSVAAGARASADAVLRLGALAARLPRP